MTQKPTVYIPGRAHPHGLQRLQQHFTVIHDESGKPSELGEEARNDIALVATFMHPVGTPFADALPNLKLVSSFGVGYDHVDAAALAERAIVTTHTPHVLDDEVADTAIALLINTVRELPSAERWLRNGKWQAIGNYRLTPLTLRGRTVGIAGLGRIGLAIARRLEGFGVTIAYHNRSQRPDVPYPYHGDLLEMARAVDTVISVLPGTKQTDGVFNAQFFKALGANGVFINVGRGSSVDEADLAEALKDGTIAAAGLDVFADEPNVPQALFDCDNAVLLPHVASASVATRNAMADLVVDNLIAFADGKPLLTPVPEAQGLL